MTTNTIIPLQMTVPFPGLVSEVVWCWCKRDKTICCVRGGVVYANPCVLLPRLLPGLDPEAVWEAMRVVLNIDTELFNGDGERPFMCGVADLMLIIATLEKLDVVDSPWHCSYARAQILAQLCPETPAATMASLPAPTRKLALDLCTLWDTCEKREFRMMWGEMERWPAYANGGTLDLVKIFGGSVHMALATIMGDGVTPQDVHTVLCEAGVDDPQVPRPARNVLLNYAINRRSPLLAQRLPISNAMLSFMAHDAGLEAPEAASGTAARLSLMAFKGCATMAAKCARAEDAIWAQHHMHNAYVHAARFYDLCTSACPPRTTADWCRPRALRTPEPASNIDSFVRSTTA